MFRVSALRRLAADPFGVVGGKLAANVCEGRGKLGGRASDDEAGKVSAGAAVIAGATRLPLAIAARDHSGACRARMTSAKGANASAVATTLLVFSSDCASFGGVGHEQRQYTETGAKLLTAVTRTL